MIINELPNDCILLIFESLNQLDDLLSCYKVCVKWSSLVAQRMKQVKYLFEDDGWSDCIYGSSESLDSINLKSDQTSFDIFENFALTTLDNLLCNMKIVVLSVESSPTELYELISTSESCRGIVFSNGLQNRTMDGKYCQNLEMLATDRIEHYCRRQRRGPRLKQLCLIDNTLEYFSKLSRFFPNLERIRVTSHANPYTLGKYTINDNLEKLKIFELFSFELGLFKFLDHCPALQSAYICTNPDSVVFANAHPNLNLKDLVLDLHYSAFVDEDEVLSEDTMERLCTKYPNIKHLALRQCPWIEKEHVKVLIMMLSKLVLLDLRGSGLNQTIADVVNSYNKKTGRSIKVYFEGGDDDIKQDWPELSSRRERIGRGFDFMKNCFLKSFESIPWFLDPIDSSV